MLPDLCYLQLLTSFVMVTQAKQTLLAAAEEFPDTWQAFLPGQSTACATVGTPGLKGAHVAVGRGTAAVMSGKLCVR